MSDITSFAGWFIEQFSGLDLLINNAGGVSDEYKQTKQGIEFTIGVNHLANHLLVELLFEKLSPQSRVVNVASVAHVQVDDKAGLKPDWEVYFNPEKNKYNSWKA